METSIAYCGLNCGTCPIHLATLELDKSHQQSMRESIAELCSKQYGFSLQPEEITDCDGCKADTGRLFLSCNTCGIRTCADQKDIEFCAYCTEYACLKLQELFLLDPDAKLRLEEIRNFPNKEWRNKIGV